MRGKEQGPRCNECKERRRVQRKRDRRVAAAARLGITDAAALDDAALSVAAAAILQPKFDAEALCPKCYSEICECECSNCYGPGRASEGVVKRHLVYYAFTCMNECGTTYGTCSRILL